jgi:YggT family protein
MTLTLILTSIVKFLEIYGYILIVRILLSWFQGAEWAYNIISFLSPITDPYLNIFRSFIPPIGGIDLSAILAILALQLLQSLFASSLGQAYASMGSF